MKSPYKAILFDLFGTLISVSKAAGDGGRYTADILYASGNHIFTAGTQLCGNSSSIALALCVGN
ncbi:MAG: hypothetical protein G8D88_14995, partial [gamma proteobacterium symbiont of Ctena orbiculata]